jgi:hypothetical protein
MTTAEKPSVEADLEEVCRRVVEGKGITDPDLLKRIQEQSEKVQAENLRLFGVQDIGVEIIREMREAE